MSLQRVDPELGAALEAACQRAGLDKIHVAARTGLSTSTVYLALKGVVSTKTLRQLAPALGLNLDELLGHRTVRTGER